MSSCDRLAEAAREHNEKCDAHPGGSVDAALAAYDADADRRDAERAVIDAADTWEKKRLQNVATAGAIPPTVVDLIAAVRRLREFDK